MRAKSLSSEFGLAAADTDVSSAAGAFGLTRNGLFGSLAIIASFNGFYKDAAEEIAEKGIFPAVFNTFGISIFVWGALFAGLVLFRRARHDPAERLDYGIAALCVVAILVPVPAASWLAITLMSAYLMLRSRGNDALRKGAIVFLAMTVPAFWSRVMVSLFSDAILAVDATMVSWVVGTSRNGNVVPFADGSGAMWIAPDCSSFANLSLAMLAVVVCVNLTTGRWSRSELLCGLSACAAVIGINVARISLIGLFPAQFDLIHGEIGASVAGWLSTAAILAICFIGIKRDEPALG